MEDLFIALMLISLGCFLISWLFPNIFYKLFQKESKALIRTTFGLASVIFFVAFGITSDTSKPENLKVAEQQTGQSPVVAETKSEAPAVQQPQDPQFIFDVPALIGKNIDEVKAVLGSPTTYTAPTKQQLALMDIWDMEYTKDDVNLLITYNPKSKTVLDYFIDGSDKAKLLALGKLQEKNDAYIAEFVKNISNPNEILGVKIIKKLPAELDGSVAYNAVAFQISNDEDYGWTNCRFEINGGIISDGYEYKTSSGIKAKDKLVIPFSEFTKDGERFNFYTQKPEKLFIACDTLGQHRTNYFAIK